MEAYALTSGVIVIRRDAYVYYCEIEYITDELNATPDFITIIDGYKQIEIDQKTVETFYARHKIQPYIRSLIIASKKIK